MAMESAAEMAIRMEVDPAVRIDLDRPNRGPSAAVSDDVRVQALLRHRGRLWRVRYRPLTGDSGRLVEAATAQEAKDVFAAKHGVPVADCRAVKLER